VDGIAVRDIDTHKLMLETLKTIRLLDIEDGYLRTRTAERIGNSPSDTAAAAGDDGPMITKIELRLARKF